MIINDFEQGVNLHVSTELNKFFELWGLHGSDVGGNELGDMGWAGFGDFD